MIDLCDNRTIWCGNLPTDATEELLFELFLQAAPLEKVHIPSDGKGDKYNYAFVICKHESSVPYAIQLLDGTVLFDNILKVRQRTKNFTQVR